MPKYTVRIGPAAVRDIKKLDRKVQEKLIQCFDCMAFEPRPRGVEKLSQNPRFWRLRNGDYRVVYHVDDPVLTIYILVVRRRKDAYRELDNLDAKLVAATKEAAAAPPNLGDVNRPPV